MRFAYSIYWGGTVVDAIHCDYQSSRELGLHCPFCNEALFFKAAHTRTMPDGSHQQVAASFAHYPGVGLDCELRAKRPEGEKHIQQLEINSRNQRLILFNKHFIRILRHHIAIEDEQGKVKVLRKILGKNFMEPFVKLFLDQKITLEFIKYQASQNLKRINVTANYPEIPEIVKDQLKLTAKKITSYMTNRNLVIAYEAALWLQSKSATWALERLILFVFIAQCESLAMVNCDSICASSIRKYVKPGFQFLTQNADLCLSLIFSMFISVNWQYIGLDDSNKYS